MTVVEHVGIQLDTQSVPQVMKEVIGSLPENATLKEKILRITEFLESNLINALVVKDIPESVLVEITSNQPRTMEQVLQTKWGYCTEYAATAAYLLALMKEKSVIQFGRLGHTKHRYLDVFNTDLQKWEIFDPLAILTGKARGNNATLFDLDFYKHSQSFQRSSE